MQQCHWRVQLWESALLITVCSRALAREKKKKKELYELCNIEHFRPALVCVLRPRLHCNIFLGNYYQLCCFGLPPHYNGVSDKKNGKNWKNCFSIVTFLHLDGRNRTVVKKTTDVTTPSLSLDQKKQAAGLNERQPLLQSLLLLCRAVLSNCFEGLMFQTRQSQSRAQASFRDPCNSSTNSLASPWSRPACTTFR